MQVDDYDGDGNLDILMNGNDYGTEVSVGRYDALNGLLLKGNGKGPVYSLEYTRKRHIYSRQWQGPCKIKRCLRASI